MKRLIITAVAALMLLPLSAQNNMKLNQKVFTQTAGRASLGQFAPEFAHFNDDILFGELWNKQDILTPHEHSLVTIISLMAQGITDSSLKYHLQTAKANGVTRQELADVVTHAAFYAGWPKAWGVFNLAKEVWADDSVQTKEEFQMSTPYPIGEPNAWGKYFIGNSYLVAMSPEPGAPINVTFEPGCRNNWHVHHGYNQVLTCVAGRGWYQEWGKEPVALTPGTVIFIPKEVKHWHGAAADSWMQHLVYNANVEEGNTTEWLEPVTDEVYKLAK